MSSLDITGYISSIGSSVSIIGTHDFCTIIKSGKHAPIDFVEFIPSNTDDIIKVAKQDKSFFCRKCAILESKVVYTYVKDKVFSTKNPVIDTHMIMKFPSDNEYIIYKTPLSLLSQATMITDTHVTPNLMILDSSRFLDICQMARDNNGMTITYSSNFSQDSHATCHLSTFDTPIISYIKGELDNIMLVDNELVSKIFELDDGIYKSIAYCNSDIEQLYLQVAPHFAMFMAMFKGKNGAVNHAIDKRKFCMMANFYHYNGIYICNVSFAKNNSTFVNDSCKLQLYTPMNCLDIIDCSKVKPDSVYKMTRDTYIYPVPKVDSLVAHTFAEYHRLQYIFTNEIWSTFSLETFPPEIVNIYYLLDPNMVMSKYTQIINKYCTESCSSIQFASFKLLYSRYVSKVYKASGMKELIYDPIFIKFAIAGEQRNFRRVLTENFVKKYDSPKFLLLKGPAVPRLVQKSISRLLSLTGGTEKVNYWIDYKPKKLDETSVTSVLGGAVIISKTIDTDLSLVLKINIQPSEYQDFSREAHIGLLISKYLGKTPNFAITLGEFNCKSPIDFSTMCKYVPGKQMVHAQYIVMEFIPGQPIKGEMKNMNSIEFLSTIQQICLALALAKSKTQFTHYDLHYGNILVTRISPVIYRYNINGKKYDCVAYYNATIIDYGRSYIIGAPYIKPMDFGAIVDCNFYREDVEMFDIINWLIYNIKRNPRLKNDSNVVSALKEILFLYRSVFKYDINTTFAEIVLTNKPPDYLMKKGGLWPLLTVEIPPTGVSPLDVYNVLSKYITVNYSDSSPIYNISL